MVSPFAFDLYMSRKFLSQMMTKFKQKTLEDNAVSPKKCHNTGCPSMGPVEII